MAASRTQADVGVPARAAASFTAASSSADRRKVKTVRRSPAVDGAIGGMLDARPPPWRRISNPQAQSEGLGAATAGERL